MKSLGLAALVLLVLSGCNFSPKAAHVDPALSTLVPPDITIMAGVHVEDLLKTSLYEKHLAQRSIPMIDEFAHRTGLDVRTQVWEVLYLSDGKASAVLGRGKFSNEAEPRLPESALPSGSTRFGYKTYNFTGTDRSAVVFLSPTVAGAGDTALLKRIIDTRDKTNGPPAVLTERMQEIPPDAAIWAVSSGSPVTFPAKAGETKDNITANLGSVLGYIQSASFYLDLRPGGNGRATTTSANAADAKQLHDALLGIIGIARLMGSKDSGLGAMAGVDQEVLKGQPQLLGLLDALRVTQEDRRVNLYIDQPEPVLVQLLQLLAGPTAFTTK